MYVIGSFFGKPDLLGKFYLYIGITSLCLYSSTVFFILQDGIVHKLPALFLCELQICAQQIQNLMTFQKAFAIVIVFGQLCPGRFCKAAAWEEPRRYFCFLQIINLCTTATYIPHTHKESPTRPWKTSPEQRHLSKSYHTVPG